MTCRLCIATSQFSVKVPALQVVTVSEVELKFSKHSSHRMGWAYDDNVPCLSQQSQHKIIHKHVKWEREHLTQNPRGSSTLARPFVKIPIRDGKRTCIGVETPFESREY